MSTDGNCLFVCRMVSLRRRKETGTEKHDSAVQRRARTVNRPTDSIASAGCMGFPGDVVAADHLQPSESLFGFDEAPETAHLGARAGRAVENQRNPAGACHGVDVRANAGGWLPRIASPSKPRYR